MQIRITIPTFAILIVLCSLSACTQSLARFIVETPNHGKSFDPICDATPDWQLRMLGVDQEITIEIDEPRATLAAWVIEPTNHETPRGTILVLHGFRGDRFWMLHKARDLSAHGYRTVCVALRGQD